MLCDRARPSLEHSVCDESVDNPDYHDGRKSNCPIGNLNARYRRFPAKPFHGFSPRWAPGEKRSTGDYAVIGLTDAPKIVSGYHPSRRPCRVFFASLGMETFHTLSTLAHALFRYRLVSSFAQTPPC